MIRRVLLLAVALAPMTLAAQDGASTATSTFAGVTFPDDVRVFSIAQATRYDDPSLGIALTYTSQQIASELTVYVYPLPEDAESPESAVQEQFQSAWSDIQQYAVQNRDGVELEMGEQVDVEIVDDAGTARAGRRGDTVMRGGGGALDSLLLVFEKDGSLIKYRITYERPSRRIIGPHLEAFLSTTLAVISTGLD